MVEQDPCICGDKETMMLKFMYGWRYCAFCGKKIDDQIMFL